MEKSSTTSGVTPMGVYITAPFTPYYFEDEVADGLTKDDATVLEERYRYRVSSSSLKDTNSLSSKPSNLPPSSSKAVRERQQRLTKSTKSQTQWTRALDAVQEHFSSHVSLDGSTHKLPPNIYALKTIAKHNWVLYKKRECERRKRIRRKLEKEKDNERNGKPANVLMAMVDSCEACKRLYVTVNLFWGVTLCDSCYFNPGVINDIMKTRNEMADQKMNYTPENIVKEVIRYRKEFFANKSYYEVPTSSSTSTTSSSSNAASSVIVVSSPPNTHPLEKMEIAESILSGDDDLLSLSPCTTSSEAEEDEEVERSEEKGLPTPIPFTPYCPTPRTPLPPTNDSQISSFVNEVVDYFEESDFRNNNDMSPFFGNIGGGGGGSQMLSMLPSLSQFSLPSLSQIPKQQQQQANQNNDEDSRSNLFTENPLSFHYESTKYKSPH